ncbi:SDR family NAD(P)-dependent oxidoreductase [Gluconobacter wancherniae]|uniref:Short-chain dehydrogenase n=1 Tax=Gluconobacter wancherniae NBRC 103581 TaxID=656744 RepID=A0A511B0N1_9PROT|nr:SDR family NAD(P)-dependent oxidoreductase [Gluconobacter wancherniae]MBF0853525.1 SDR family NAD(P)-dependent oxidoreductase [Gluconobacter wancherniae]GBD55732.1 short-chain dehydrogenase [Gluconobacter wancherniae NBRC 103581]GBR66232.1 oxidoreductase [Gluconobacter wancherniae NBRC 103581]GEK93362.1 short-chain dehydrogenase [Gluconobacter wancherniae NBRC 103581]
MTSDPRISATQNGRHILITGASSGIGAALARYYARPGNHLTLWGRNTERLEKCAQEARRKGAAVTILALDLCDTQAALSAFIAADDARAVDMLILGAGLGDIRPVGALAEKAEDVLAISLVNFTTPVTLASEAAGRMAARKKGWIGLIGSVAAFHDLPVATAYSGSKAGLARFSTALHAAMTPHDVKVTLISPGYVDTAMSQRLEGARPFLVSAEKAARLIANAMEKGRAHLLFPWPFQLVRLLEAIMPRALVHRIVRSAKVVQRPQL